MSRPGGTSGDSNLMSQKVPNGPKCPKIGRIRVHVYPKSGRFFKSDEMFLEFVKSRKSWNVPKGPKCPQKERMTCRLICCPWGHLVKPLDLKVFLKLVLVVLKNKEVEWLRKTRQTHWILTTELTNAGFVAALSPLKSSDTSIPFIKTSRSDGSTGAKKHPTPTSGGDIYWKGAFTSKVKHRAVPGAK